MTVVGQYQFIHESSSSQRSIVFAPRNNSLDVASGPSQFSQVGLARLGHLPAQRSCVLVLPGARSRTPRCRPCLPSLATYHLTPLCAPC
jgi:hypothetical protein